MSLNIYLELRYGIYKITQRLGACLLFTRHVLIYFKKSQFHTESVESSTVEPDIPVTPGLNSNPAQLRHRLDKSSIERVRARRPRRNGVFGPGIREQNLIRCE